jgi:hypothetical protein
LEHKESGLQIHEEKAINMDMQLNDNEYEGKTAKKENTISFEEFAVRQK